MDIDIIIHNLDKYSELKARIDIATMDYNAAREKMMAPVQAQIDALMATVQPQLDALSAAHHDLVDELVNESEQLEAEIKEQVKHHGATVKGAHIMAVWSKGRVSWDTKGLDGYAAAHPEIDRFRHVGEPSVSFRAVNGT